MRSVAVIGGSVVGSVAALLFARSGWEVTVVDPELDTLCGADPDHLVLRPGAPQTVQAHGFMSRTLHELSTHLPDLREALVEAGAPLVPVAASMPPHLYDGGRLEDDELTTLRVRRVTMDRVIGAAVEREPGISRMVRKAAGLLVDEGAPPTVRGLVVDGVGGLRADVVVDAGGRRSPVSGWLRDLGAAPLERHDPCAARYYTRHFSIRPGAVPPLNRGFAEVHDFPSLTQLLFLGDNGTAMLAQAVHDDDPVLKSLRSPEVFDATAACNPAFARWWDVLEPTSEVFCLGAFDNRLRRLVADGQPLVHGIFQVGDALAMTNPTRGRGVSMGFAAASRLHDLLAVDGLAGAEACSAFDQWVEQVLTVYYRESVVSDAAVARRLRAGLLGQAVPANAPRIELPADHPITCAELERAGALDPDLFRLVLRATMMMDDDRRVASPEVAARVRTLLMEAPPAEVAPPEPTDGLYDRATLVGALAGFL